MLTRRQMLKRGAIGGAGLMVTRVPLATAAPAAVGATPRLRRWVEPLPIPPVLDGRGVGGESFAIAARESTSWKFHPDLPAMRTWGYWSDNPSAGLPYLGPTIEATRRPNDTTVTSVTVEWRNELGNAFLPNDPTIFGAVMPGQPAPIVTHLHGGENHPQFDGTPLQWFTGEKGRRTKGPHYITNTYTYWNEQRASMVWYHDHAVGNTRTNVYAGLAGVYLIRDDQDTGEAGNPLGLPAGPRYEIPLVLQDKTFNADGSLFYPTQGVVPEVHPEWAPEFFGDVAVVNAKIWPFVDVEPRRYRLRIVNGSQSRFYNLQFANDTTGTALPFAQIGADGGLARARADDGAADRSRRARRRDHRLRRAEQRLVHRHQQRPGALPDGRARDLVAAAEDPRQPGAPGAPTPRPPRPTCSFRSCPRCPTRQSRASSTCPRRSIRSPAPRSTSTSRTRRT